MTSRELTSGFDFWSRGHLRTAVIFGADIFIQSGVIGIFPKFKMAEPPSWIERLCEFGHSGVLIVWYLCSVPNLAQISVTVTEIDALRTYPSDLLLMTSRKLTSGFDFWSRRHLRMAVMHLLIKFGAGIFIQSGVLDIFPKFKMAAAAILDFQIM